MGRFNVAVETPAALAAGNVFASIQAGAAAGFKLRRLSFGVRAGATVPTSQQLTIALTRVTTRGVTPTSTTAFQKMDPNSGASGITGLDLGPFGTPPVLAAVTSASFTFNTQAGYDVPWEQLEEWAVTLGAANGIGLTNVGNALPASHLLTVHAEIEE